MVAIVDYGVGNLFSLKSSLKSIGVETIVTGNKEDIEKADKIILPGVGAFGDAAQKLRETGLDEVVISEAQKGKKILGICLGMQLLFEKSYEFGEHEGLGLIKGSIKPINDYITPGLKVPQIGWNAITFPKENELFSKIKSGDYVYFVHSFHGTDCEESTIAVTEYGGTLTAAVADKNVYGTQFHPEKSGNVGMRILSAFCEL